LEKHDRDRNKKFRNIPFEEIFDENGGFLTLGDFEV